MTGLDPFLGLEGGPGIFLEGWLSSEPEIDEQRAVVPEMSFDAGLQPVYYGHSMFKKEQEENVECSNNDLLLNAPHAEIYKMHAASMEALPTMSSPADWMGEEGGDPLDPDWVKEPNPHGRVRPKKPPASSRTPKHTLDDEAATVTVKRRTRKNVVTAGERSSSDNCKKEPMVAASKELVSKTEIRKRTQRRTVPDDEKDQEYLEKRRRNNLAAQRCRKKKKQLKMEEESWNHCLGTVQFPADAQELMHDYGGKIGDILIAAFTLGQRFPFPST